MLAHLATVRIAATWSAWRLRRVHGSAAGETGAWWVSLGHFPVGGGCRIGGDRDRGSAGGRAESDAGASNRLPETAQRKRRTRPHLRPRHRSCCERRMGSQSRVSVPSPSVKRPSVTRRKSRFQAGSESIGPMRRLDSADSVDITDGGRGSRLQPEQVRNRPATRWRSNDEKKDADCVRAFRQSPLRRAILDMLLPARVQPILGRFGSRYAAVEPARPAIAEGDKRSCADFTASSRWMASGAVMNCRPNPVTRSVKTACGCGRSRRASTESAQLSSRAATGKARYSEKPQREQRLSSCGLAHGHRFDSGTAAMAHRVRAHSEQR